MICKQGGEEKEQRWCSRKKKTDASAERWLSLFWTTRRAGVKELPNAAECITQQSADVVKWIITGLCRALPASVWSRASLSMKLIATSPGAAVTWASVWYFYPVVSQTVCRPSMVGKIVAIKR